MVVQLPYFAFTISGGDLEEILEGSVFFLKQFWGMFGGESKFGGNV